MSVAQVYASVHECMTAVQTITTQMALQIDELHDDVERHESDVSAVRDELARMRDELARVREELERVRDAARMQL